MLPLKHNQFKRNYSQAGYLPVLMSFRLPLASDLPRKRTKLI